VFFVYLTHSELPEAIGRCISLQKLFLAHNLLTALPLSVYGGGTFPHATFVDSQLTGTENYVEPTEEDETLPEEGAILTHTYTHRERERENEIIHIFAGLFQLQELDLSHNKFASLPEEFYRLNSLLKVSYCFIGHIQFPAGMVTITNGSSMRCAIC
jgi:Leucine-rich repeat (LRR) protein